jgi:phage portal protein BeeE
MAATKSPGAVRRFFLGEPPSMELERAQALSLQQYLSYFNYNGHRYPLSGLTTTLGSKEEEPTASFQGYVEWAYYNNPVVFACMEVRRALFSEARFQFRQLRSGRPGDLFGNADLAILETPWPNGTTGDLLSRAIQDVDLAGNFYAARQGDQIMRMRPDWVSIVLGSQMDEDDPALALDAEIAGYLYHPGGYFSGEEPVPLLPEQVCHFAPTPDPLARFRGMSWLTPVVREVMADSSMTSHRQEFFENGATVNLAIGFPAETSKQLFDSYVEAFKQKHEGVSNAYKTAFLGGGAQPIPIGSDMRQIDFKIVQGAGETRIAAAAGVPPVIVGLSEGLDAATYSNYSQARRRFADGTMRPLWRNVAGSLATIITVPGASELWYDDRDIPFLQDDMMDRAKIQQSQAGTINTLIIAGYEPVSVVDAVVSGDFSRLTHTGLFSVQLQPAGTDPNPPDPAVNGAPPMAPRPIGAKT